MIEVFKTNVSENARAEELTLLLKQHFPGARVNFDLEDCDNVLRIEGNNILAEHIICLMNNSGCRCEALE